MEVDTARAAIYEQLKRYGKPETLMALAVRTSCNLTGTAIELVHSSIHSFIRGWTFVGISRLDRVEWLTPNCYCRVNNVN